VNGFARGRNVGGTTTSVVLERRTARFSSVAHGPRRRLTATHSTAAIVATLRAIARTTRWRLGVAIGGPMNARTGVVAEPAASAGCNGFPIGARLRTRP